MRHAPQFLHDVISLKAYAIRTSYQGSLDMLPGVLRLYNTFLYNMGITQAHTDLYALAKLIQIAATVLFGRCDASDIRQWTYSHFVENTHFFANGYF